MERYVNDILENPTNGVNFNVPLLQLRHMRFQHDGAPAHSTSKCQECLNKVLPGLCVGRHGSVPWRTRTLDMTSLNFILRGCLRDPVYNSETKTTDALKARIRIVPPSVVRGGTQVLERRKYSIASDGDLFEHVL
ncbi:hypothetical protein HPB50_011510 [Hyalomma asiaticum]|uniref:Uncharacterized protein n=1 Tax=Hyalomma asiaticum TaxID=266040 RepID=A0ACB7TGL0_HYAAI|nr:hypothetical protein HPB50_011510 [Hyalomma asiaticum]